jgi:hypothetical protein
MTFARPPYGERLMRRCLAPLLSPVLLVVIMAVPAPAQVAKPSPVAPVLASAVPPGARRGASAEIVLTGKNLAAPTGVLATFACKVTIPTDNKNGTDATKVRVRIDVPADAPIGFHGLRLANDQGISNLVIFCVDELPEVTEAASNRDPKTAQAVPVPCVVSGQVDNLASDHYKITVQPGQRLSFDVLGRRLGGQLDPQLSIYSAKTGREMTHALDTPGLQSDARLTYTFKEGGDYLVQVKDVLNRGGANFYYRLRIGDFPCATVPYPLAAKRGGKVAVQFAGPEVDGVAPVEVSVPVEPTTDVVWVAPKRSGGPAGWPVALFASDIDEEVENEPNDDIAKAQRVAVPSGVSGRFEKYADKDYFVFAAKKGAKVTLRAHTVEMFSPAMVYMVVRNAKGGELAKTNPDAKPPADQVIEFTPPADGDYYLEVQHLNFKEGPAQVYRVTFDAGRPALEVTAPIDRWDAAIGESVVIPIRVARQNFAGPIDVKLASAHPALKGTARIEAGESAGAVVVPLPESVPPGAYAMQLTAQGTADGKTINEQVRAAEAVSDSLADLPLPPPQLTGALALGVTPKLPLRMEVTFAAKEFLSGQPVKATIKVKREAGFADQVALSQPEGVPGNAKLPALKPIPKGQDTAGYTFNLDPKSPRGTSWVIFRGKVKANGKERMVTSAPVALVIGPPFELKVEPAALKLAQGEKGKLKITATRKAGYQGPITLQLRNLPANVTAPNVTIPQGKNDAEIEVTAAANAAVGDRSDVDVLGTAPAAGNQQQASPNFTVSIAAKGK